MADVIAWLMEGDAAVRWQVQRDLLGEPESVWAAERAQVPSQGPAAALLAAQDASDTWGGGLYTPKWTSTTYTLHVLRLLGLPPGHPQALAGCDRLLAGGLYMGREFRFSRGQARRDIGASALAMGLCLYHGSRHPALGAMAAFLLSRQRPDGAWLPDDNPALEAYTLETTRLAVDALVQWAAREPLASGQGLVREAIAHGCEYLTAGSLGLRTGSQVKASRKVFAFPPYWFCDALTGLDDLRAAEAPRDSRLRPAIDLVLSRRDRTGRWKAGRPHAGKTLVELEPTGAPSRWTTLRAMRVLRWLQVGGDGR